MSPDGICECCQENRACWLVLTHYNWQGNSPHVCRECFENKGLMDDRFCRDEEYCRKIREAP